jgi:hypothetical protein
MRTEVSALGPAYSRQLLSFQRHWLCDARLKDQGTISQVKSVRGVRTDYAVPVCVVSFSVMSGLGRATLLSSLDSTSKCMAPCLTVQRRVNETVEHRNGINTPVKKQYHNFSQQHIPSLIVLPSQ